MRVKGTTLRVKNRFAKRYIAAMCCASGRNETRFYKRYHRRLIRRSEKRDPEEAIPENRFSGHY